MKSKKIISRVLYALLLIACGFIGRKIFLFKKENQKYSVLTSKIEDFKLNKNYALALNAFKDTLPSLTHMYSFENSPKDSYDNRPVLSSGPVLFNAQFTKCVVLFSLGTELVGESRIQEFYCFGELKNKWTFNHMLYGMTGMKTTGNFVENELEQSFKTLISDFNVVDSSNAYNDGFVNEGTRVYRGK